MIFYHGRRQPPANPRAYPFAVNSGPRSIGSISVGSSSGGRQRGIRAVLLGADVGLPGSDAMLP